MDTDAPTAPDQPPLFRPSKKRKIYRQRATSAPTTAIPHSPAEGATSSALPPQSPPSTAAVAVVVADDDDTAPSTAAIRRLLASRRQRGGGVEFRASNPRGADDAEEVEGEGAVVVVRRESHDDGHNEEGGLAMGGKRFVTQTGMSAEGVDRHMMAYIDSELAKRLKPAGISSADTSTPPSTSATTTGADAATASQSQRQHQPSPPYQTASRGKLMEIELPPSSTTPAPPRAAVRKPRLGRDGKPLRGKKRRTEEDIRRDNLVESIMQENSLGIYESPPLPTTSTTGDGEGDEEIEERFRREFLEGVEERRRGAGGGAGGGGGKGGGKVVGKGRKEEEGLKGPKLGGSRSARAGVREALLKAEREKR